jgi:hypothetical protein
MRLQITAENAEVAKIFFVFVPEPKVFSLRLPCRQAGSQRSLRLDPQYWVFD